MLKYVHTDLPSFICSFCTLSKYMPEKPSAAVGKIKRDILRDVSRTRSVSLRFRFWRCRNVLGCKRTDLSAFARSVCTVSRYLPE